MGDAGYHSIDNNCEHFAVWCKTGVMLSTQAEGRLMHAVRITAGGADAPQGEGAAI